MNGVIGMTGLLLETELSPEQREYADTVRSSGESLLTIINDILDFSKIEAGKLSLEHIRFDLHDAVEEVVELLAGQAETKGLELLCLIEPEVPRLVAGDPGRIRQVLTNLIGNAIKFTEQGEVVVKLLAAALDGDTAVVRFEVSDTGIGIPDEAQGRLFQSFSQADGSTTRRFGGTGLGLAICKQLVGLMGGEIGLTSAVKKGSLFWFTTRLERHRDGEFAALESQRRIAGARALYVDDNAVNRRILERQLVALGLHVETVESGTRALDSLRRAQADGRPFQLALLDMQMPEMDGLMLARAIRSDPALAGLPTILLSSLGQALPEEELKSHGIDARLAKPIRRSHLIASIAEVLVRSRPAAEDPPRPDAALPRREIPAGSKGHLLLAEDNPVNKRVATRMLERLGYRVEVVENGSQALALLTQQSFDLVLMDCQMPEMDGFETTRAIRLREANGQRTPIVAMTANAMQGDRERCLEAGMDDYIAKPVVMKNLEEVLERWMSRARGPSAESPTPS
jgi:CheY-like chemotaxis protein